MPAFVFGTGRCGSTHLQRAITLTTDHWIWGEHGGYLTQLLNGLQEFETNPGLIDISNPLQLGLTDAKLIEHMTSGSDYVCWLNRIHTVDLREPIRHLIDRMFRQGLPQGWNEWGFKEIVYGEGNDAPAQLLSLFPTATAAFTFREPRATVNSMIRAWSPQLVGEPLLMLELSDTYRSYCNRWLSVTRYFLGLKPEARARVVFVSTGAMARLDMVIARMGLCPRAETFSRPISATNVLGTTLPADTEAIGDKVFAASLAEMTDVYEQLLARCEEDFAYSLHSSLLSPDS